MSESRQVALRRQLAKLGTSLESCERVPVSRKDRELYRIRTGMDIVLYFKHFHERGDFEREVESLRLVQGAVGPTIERVDEQELVLVTRSVEGTPAHALPAAQQASVLARCVPPFRALLSSVGVTRVDPIPFPRDSQFEKYHAEMARISGRSVSVLKAWLDTQQPLLPCHGDLTPRNVIVGQEVRFIDFEWFGVGQPLYDAATLCLSPLLLVASAERAAGLRAFADAVGWRTGAPVTTAAIAGAATAWAIRFAEALDVNRARVESGNPWRAPIEVAVAALDRLVSVNSK